jgi:hypothetical protein
MTAVDPTGETVVVSGENVFPGCAGDDAVRTLLSLASSHPVGAKERFPDYRLTRLVLTRFDMDDVEASVFIDLTEATAPASVLGGTPFNDHLRTSINRFALTELFSDDGPGRHHQAIRPTGYDYYIDAVDAAAMEKWRADYRAMSPAQRCSPRRSSGSTAAVRIIGGSVVCHVRGTPWMRSARCDEAIFLRTGESSSRFIQAGNRDGQAFAPNSRAENEVWPVTAPLDCGAAAIRASWCPWSRPSSTIWAASRSRPQRTPATAAKPISKRSKHTVSTATSRPDAPSTRPR